MDMEIVSREKDELFNIISSWPLMSSFVPLALIFATYLAVVLKILPKFMETRKPFNLNTFTRAYNIFQVIACTSFVISSFMYGFRLETTWQCLADESDPKQFMTYKNIYWWFMMLRICELVETVVFVLRKKQNQVSALHVYHVKLNYIIGESNLTRLIYFLELLAHQHCCFGLDFPKILHL
jgi:hypothetical protein